MFEPLRLLPLLDLAARRPRGQAIVGMRSDGRPAVLDLMRPATQHINILGAPGTGKSELLRTILASLCLNHSPAELRCLLVNPGGRELAAIAALPHALDGTSGDSLADIPLEGFDQRTELVVAVDGAPQAVARDWIVQALQLDLPQLHMLIVGDWPDLPGARLRAESVAMFASDSGARIQAAYLPAMDLNRLVRAARLRWSGPEAAAAMPVRMASEQLVALFN